MKRLRLTALASAGVGAVLWLGSASTSFAGVLEGNHPKVQEGTEAFQKGDFEGALRAYEEASQQLPRRPEVRFNQGDAAMKLGRLDEAKQAFEAALQGASEPLKARAYFNLGNAFAGLQQKDEAVTAYRQALKVEPGFEPARHNLEVMLRKKRPPQEPPPGDGGMPDAGADGGSSHDAGDSPKRPDGGVADSGQGDSGQNDQGKDGGASQSDGGQRDGGGGQGDAGPSDAGSQDGGTAAKHKPESAEPAKPVNKTEAEQLLDTVRRSEKHFLMQQHNQKVKQRVRPEKDW